MEQTPLPVIASGYRTNVTSVPVAAGAWVRVAEANPARWFVRFDLDIFGAISSTVGPAPIQNLAVPPNTSNFPLESKFRDAPSSCTGEWYANVNPAGSVIVTECTYAR